MKKPACKCVPYECCAQQTAHDTPAAPEGQGTVAGYVTLVAAAIEVPQLPSILDADQHLAIRALIVDALNDYAAAWYAGWGFKPLPGGACNRLWLPIKRVRASLDR